MHFTYWHISNIFSSSACQDTIFNFRNLNRIAMRWWSGGRSSEKTRQLQIDFISILMAVSYHKLDRISYFSCSFLVQSRDGKGVEWNRNCRVVFSSYGSGFGLYIHMLCTSCCATWLGCHSVTG